MIVAIDGPSSSGKSTVSRMVAIKLGYYYVNSGFIFRAVAYVAMVKDGIDTSMKDDYVPSWVDTFLQNGTVEYRYDHDVGVTVWYNNTDISAFLKDGQVGEMASIIANILIVRIAIKKYIVQLVGDRSAVIDGRDAGVGLFPHADIKIYLTAPLAVRAKRFWSDQVARGNPIDMQTATEMIASRDKRDEKRLPIASFSDEFLIIDNADISVDDVVNMIVDKIMMKS